MPRFQRFLILLVCSVLVLTACAQGGVQPDFPTVTSPPKLDPSLPIPQAPPTPISALLQQLDLRFAHILEVSYEPLDSSQYRFDVTLVHDDDGEAPQFADWWQVEDLSAQVLGRRVLTHSHGSQPFTRSVTIAIPLNVDAVIIRGHDMLHGFGGQAIQLNLTTGEQQIMMTAP